MQVDELRGKIAREFAEADQRVREATHVNGKQCSYRLLFDPDEELAQACFNLCSAWGLGRYTGADVPDGLVDPFLVRTAMPVCTEELKNFNWNVRKLRKANASLTLTVAIGFFDELMRCTGAMLTAGVTHEAIHDGCLVEKMGSGGLSWGPRYFCPDFHLLEQEFQDLGELLRKNRYLYSAIAGTEYSRDWIRAFRIGFLNPYAPWWFSSDKQSD